MTVPQSFQQRINNLTLRPFSDQLTGNVNYLTRSNIYENGQMADFITGVLALKKSGIYDQFVQLHMDAMAGGVAHNGPAFLPWHRRFLLEFELNMAVALNNQNYALPYWDWSADLANLTAQGKTLNQAAVYTSNGLGASLADYAVGTPFDAASWKIHDLSGNPNVGHLLRVFSPSNATNLATPEFITNLIHVPGYETGVNGNSGFRPILEVNIHNVFHSWVGGQMDRPFSPDEPTFFLHHCFMDKLWAEWQFRYFGLYEFESPQNQPGQTAGQPMQSAAGVNWSNVIGATGTVDGISNTTPENWEIHESFGYRYDDEMSWNKPTLIRPTDPTANSLMADATSRQGIGLTPFPADYKYQNGIFLLRPGYFSSPKHKSVMIQSVPLSIQTFGTNYDHTDPEQGIYYFSNVWHGAITAERYGYDSRLQRQTDQMFEYETFAMVKPNPPIQGLHGVVAFFIHSYPATPTYVTTNNNNSALEETSDSDQAENFGITGLPLVPR